jgi:hypothetical protein
MLTKHATDPALGYMQFAAYLINASPTTRGA